MNLSELKTFAEQMSEANPKHDDQIRDFYFLAVSEVESGESETNECELAYSDINQLINENDEQE
tara:strand:- start:1610 stop:1801 length:192 start_codon:yes stop_codon:yes gene_type:complete